MPRNLVITCLLIILLATPWRPVAAQPREWLDAPSECAPVWPPVSGDACLAAPFALQGCPPYRNAASMPALLAAPGEWHDPMDDTFGMSAINGTTTVGGEIVLTQLAKHADVWYRVLAMVEGDDGKIYFGTEQEARLWVYDPASGAVEDRGQPVPAEYG